MKIKRKFIDFKSIMILALLFAFVSCQESINESIDDVSNQKKNLEEEYDENSYDTKAIWGPYTQKNFYEMMIGLDTSGLSFTQFLKAKRRNERFFKGIVPYYGAEYLEKEEEIMARLDTTLKVDDIVVVFYPEEGCFDYFYGDEKFVNDLLVEANIFPEYAPEYPPETGYHPVGNVQEWLDHKGRKKKKFYGNDHIPRYRYWVWRED